MIPETDGAPVYARIRAHLRDRIRGGEWPQGVKLPSRQRLAREYGVDLDTLQRAVIGLLEDGTLSANQGKGTFVGGGDGVAVSAQSMSKRTRRRPKPAVDQHDELLTAPSVLRRLLPNRQPQVAGNLAIIFSVTRLFREITDKVPQGIAQSMLLRVEEDPWLMAAATAAETTFSARGGSVRTYVYAEEPNALNETISTAYADGADVIIVINLHDAPEDIIAALQSCGAYNRAVVVTWKELPDPVPHIFYDQRYAGFEAAEHLLASGCERILFFAPASAEWVAERMLGARAAVKAASLPEDRLVVYPKSPPSARYVNTDLLSEPFDAALTAIDSLLLPEKQIRRERWGILAIHDFAAMGFVNAASTRSLTMCKDYSLIGFDSTTFSRIIGISSLRPPLEEMGREAAHQAANLLSGEPLCWQARLQSQLAARQSTRPWASK